jgi:hypothetical protein
VLAWWTSSAVSGYFYVLWGSGWRAEAGCWGAAVSRSTCLDSVKRIVVRWPRLLLCSAVADLWTWPRPMWYRCSSTLVSMEQPVCAEVDLNTLAEPADAVRPRAADGEREGDCLQWTECSSLEDGRKRNKVRGLCQGFSERRYWTKLCRQARLRDARFAPQGVPGEGCVHCAQFSVLLCLEVLHIHWRPKFDTVRFVWQAFGIQC